LRQDSAIKTTVEANYENIILVLIYIQARRHGWAQGAAAPHVPKMMG
jgi:hypothetical protein